jgi:hypothetical protein
MASCTSGNFVSNLADHSVLVACLFALLLSAVKKERKTKATKQKVGMVDSVRFRLPTELLHLSFTRHPSAAFTLLRS